MLQKIKRSTFKISRCQSNIFSYIVVPRKVKNLKEKKKKTLENLFNNPVIHYLQKYLGYLSMNKIWLYKVCYDYMSTISIKSNDNIGKSVKIG